MHLVKRIKRRIDRYIVGVVIGKVTIGGNCGLCGAWIVDQLLPTAWRIGICDKCVREAQEVEGGEEDDTD